MTFNLLGECGQFWYHFVAVLDVHHCVHPTAVRHFEISRRRRLQTACTSRKWSVVVTCGVRLNNHTTIPPRQQLHDPAPCVCVCVCVSFSVCSIDQPTDAAPAANYYYGGGGGGAASTS